MNFYFDHLNEKKKFIIEEPFIKYLFSSFRFVGKEIEWSGSGDEEIGREKGTDIVRVKVNPKYYRPTEVEELKGDASKAREEDISISSGPTSSCLTFATRGSLDP